LHCKGARGPEFYQRKNYAAARQPGCFYLAVPRQRGHKRSLFVDVKKAG